MSKQPTKRLLVVRGPDAGTWIDLDERVKIVGRSRDAHLALRDQSVSRHHFHVRAAENGANVRVCSGAAPLLLDGRESVATDVKIGDSVLVGNSLLLVTEEEAPESRPKPAHDGATTTVGSLLSGVAADVRGIAGMFALNRSLAAAVDVPAIEAALASWAKTHAACESVEIHAAPIEVHAAPEDQPVPVGPASPDDALVRETVTPSGGTKILVPAQGVPTGWLAFTTKLSQPRMTDSLRRILVLAAALCASRFAQISLLQTVREDRESLRQQALGSAHAFLGNSVAAGQLTRVIPKLAGADVTVLLLGESGVGKSFVARLIHESGPRKDEPLRVINCASIPENLIESELFGHERGAFTGAVAAQPGAFEAAGHGTVLLDEIGELPLASQAKLLRVLEDRRFERVGSNQSRSMHARIIAATNRDLESMVAAGTFRRDLYFRVSVVKAVVPPLRERGDDLPLLAERILFDFAPIAGRRIEGFSREALDAIRSYPWPGNVRELRNAIEHAVVLGDGPRIAPSDLSIPLFMHGAPPTASNEDPFVVRLPMNLELLEERAIEAALHETGGNQTKAAARLGINRHTLANKRRGSGK